MIPYTRTMKMMMSGWTRARINLTDPTSVCRFVIRSPLKDVLEVNLHTAPCCLGNLNSINGYIPGRFSPAHLPVASAHRRINVSR